MSDKAAYFALVKDYPELFENAADGGLEILLDESEIQEAENFIAEKLRAAGAPPEWAEVGVAFRDQYTCILRDAVRFPGGKLGTYIRDVIPGPIFPGVVMLPVCAGKVLLIRHFRHATRKWHLEIPRGFGMSSDSAESARIELTEEISASDVELIKLGSVDSDASVSNTTIDIFYASVGSYGEASQEEAISGIYPVDIPEFERMIIEGELRDGYLIMAYGLAKARQLI